MIIYFTPEENNCINNKISDFVNKLSSKGQSTDYYHRQREVNRYKAKMDQMIGKKAEFAVAKYLHDYAHFPLLNPDLEIRQGSYKGWYCDLPYNKINSKLPNIHVKSCTQSTLRFVGDYSWTFQISNKYGKGGYDHIFNIVDDPNEQVALVYLEKFESDEVDIKGIGRWIELRTKLVEPVKPTLKGLKLCLNYRDVECLLQNK